MRRDRTAMELKARWGMITPLCFRRPFWTRAGMAPQFWPMRRMPAVPSSVLFPGWKHAGLRCPRGIFLYIPQQVGWSTLRLYFLRIEDKCIRETHTIAKEARKGLRRTQL